MGIQSISQPSTTPVAVPSAAPQANAATPPSPPVTQAQPQEDTASNIPSAESLNKAVKELQTKVQPQANNLQFSVDDGTGQTVVRVVDSNTGTTIRQIPSEEVLQIARNIDKLQGLLLKDKA